MPQRLVQGCAAICGGMALVVCVGWVFGQWRFATFGADYIPMAPLTAWMFFLLSAALFMRAGWPSSPATRYLGFATALVVVLVCAPILLPKSWGLWIPIERWLAPGTADVGGVPVGRMSFLSAATFILAVMALLFAQPSLIVRRFCRNIAAGCAATTLLIGLVVLQGYVYGVPLLYGTGSVPMALLTAVAFAVLGVGLLLVAAPDHWLLRLIMGGPSAGPVVPSRRFEWALLLGFLLLIAAIGTTGFMYLRRQAAHARKEAENELSAIADLKIQQITNWRAERLGDARFFANAMFVRRDVQAFLSNPSSASAQAEVVHWLTLLKAGDRYDRVRLFDGESNLRLLVPENGKNPGPLARQHVAEVMAARKAVMIDLHHRESFDVVHLDLAFPVFAPETANVADARPVAVILLELNPRQFLYPLIQPWPTPSQTAETLLVRREGDDVLFLNELRHRKNTALVLRQPASAPHLPAAMAVRGETGVYEGVDYRGVPVLSAIRAVPDSPWFIVSKVDQEEVFAPLRQQAWATGIILALLIGVVALGVALLWRQRFADSLRRELVLERERKSLADRLAVVTRHANDIILLLDDQWNILEANARAVEAYGHSPTALQQMRAADLRAPEARAAFARDVEPLQASGCAVLETVHQRKDGSIFPVEISARLVEISGVRYTLAIIRDITQRKAHEREINRLTRLYAALSQVNQSIVRVKSQEELFREVCRVTAEFGGFKAVWIGWRDPKTQQVMPVARGGNDGGYLDKITVYADDRPEGHGPVGTCIREDRSCVSNDFLNDPRMLPWREAALVHGLRAVAALPIHLNGDVWGAFTVYDGETDAFQDKEIALLEEAAMDIAYAMQNLEKEAQRQAAETALRESERLLRQVIDLVPHHIFAKDREGRYLFLNRAAAESVGRHPRDMVGRFELEFSCNRAYTEVFLKDDQDVIASGAPKFIPEEPITYSDGRVRFLQTIKIPFTPPGSTERGILGVAVDITERKRAEDAVRESELLYHSLVEQLPQAIFRLDRAGRITFGNSHYCELMGRELKDLLGKTDADLFPADLAAQYWADSRRVIETGEVFDSIERHFGRDGRESYVHVVKSPLRDTAGQVVGVQSIFWDVTQHKRMEQEREVTVRLLGLFNASNSTHELMRDVTLLLREWSDCDAIGIRLRDGDDYPYFETHGFPAEFIRLENQLCLRDANGQPVRDPDGNPVLECMCGNVLCKRFDPAKPFFTARGSFWTNCTTDLLASTTEADRQVRTRNRCNGEGYESVALVALRVGETTYGLLQVNDKRKDRFTTERIALLERLADSLAIAIAHRQAQENIRRLNVELEQHVRERTAELEAANKELEAFSYSVSHDLRAPLRGINGFASILNEDYAPRLDDEGRRVLKTISDEAERMGQLIDDLLAFSRVGRQTMLVAEVDMGALAQHAFNECVAAAPGRDIRFKLHPLPPAQGDPHLLPHVWTNLISNAVKYTRPKPVAEIEITGRAGDDGELVYCVKDNGAGFDMKYVERLFGVFQRLHAEADFEGTGVGLALVQRIVQRHGGRVWAESTLNEGATFRFTLPANKGQSAS